MGDGDAVEEHFVSGKRPNLYGGMVERTERSGIEAAANPDMRLVRTERELGARLPSGFVEIRRGPGGVVPRAPDALLRRDGHDGLRRERAGQRNGENQGRDNEQTRCQSLAKGKSGHEERIRWRNPARK